MENQDLKQENQEKKEEKKKEKEKKEEKKEGKKEEKKDDKKEEKKEEKKEDKKHKKEKEEKKKEYKDFFLYFIVANYTKNSLKIDCLEKKHAKDLETVKNDSLELKNEINVYYTIYKLKVTPSSGTKTLTLKFNLVEDDKNHFKSEIELKEFSHDTFFYDLIYTPEKGSKKENINVGNILSHSDQFKIYLSYLEDDPNKEKNSPEIGDLALSTRKLLTIKVKEKEKGKDKEKENKYHDLSLYFLVFAACYENPIISKILSDFDLDKVNIKYSKELSQIEKRRISEILDKMENDPEIVLKHIENTEDKLASKKDLFFFILCFRLFNERHKFETSLKNMLTHEDTQNKIYKGLAKYSDTFEGIYFEKEQITNMVRNSDTFGRIKRSLSNITYISDYYEIVLENLEHIFEIREKTIKEKTKKAEEIILEIDKKMVREDDDISSICENYGKIIDKQKEKAIEKFIILSPDILEKYMKYFKDKNLENLILLKNLVKKIIRNTKPAKPSKTKTTKKEKEEEKNSIYLKYKEIEKKLKDYIHQTGLYLSSNKMLTNIEILNFLKEDKDYLTEHNEEIKNSLSVFEGLNISSIDDEFINKWKSINWKDIFGNEQKHIDEKIIDLIVDLSGFRALLKILNTSDNNDEKTYSSEALKKMKKKFISLLDQKDNIEENSFKNDLVELIYYSDLNQDDEKISFLQNLKNINFEIMKNIYFELFNRYQDNISGEMKNYISKYLISNQNDDILITFAENFKFFIPNILTNINNYEPQKEDYWKLKEDKKLQLFKGLVEKAGISSEEYGETSIYANKSFELLNELKNELNENTVLYKYINIFFENNRDNEKDEFKKRLSLIYYNDEEKAKTKYDEIKKKIGEINNALTNLKLIQDYLNYFFEESEKVNVEKIESMISSISDGSLHDYESNYSEKCNELIEKYKEKAEKRNEMRKSIFFSALYNENKEIKNLSDIEWIETTENQFNKLKNIFSEQGIKSIDDKILTTCLNEITKSKKTINEIRKQIDVLDKIFQINASYNREEIVEKIWLLSKRDEISDAMLSLYNFVSYTGAKKTEFIKSLVEIRINLTESYNEENIIKAKEELNKANIDINNILNEENSSKINYLNILKMLREQSIKFLLKINLFDCQILREKAGEDENIVTNPNQIIDLEKCVIFMDSLKAQKNFKDTSDLELIKLFIEKFQASSEDLTIRFQSYTSNFSEIKKLFDSIKDRSEAARQKILYISKKSNFTLKNSNTDFFNVTYNEEIEKEGKKEKDEKERKIEKIEELLELKDLAQLTKKLIGKEKDKKTLFDNNKKFIAIISGIHDIYILLRKLNVSGYTNNIEIKITIDNYGYTIDWDSEYNHQDFSNAIQSLSNILNTVRTLQIKAYEEKPLIRFVYGRQFNLIKSVENNEGNKNIDPFLMFFTRNNMTNKPKDFKFSGKNDFQSVIDDCEKYLIEVLEKNNLNLEQIYKDSLIHKEYKNKGVYINYIDRSENMERDLFLIYKYLTKNFPVSQNILFCTKDTSNEELTAFLYRALLCEYNACFIMGGIESLDSGKRAKILSLLNNLLVEKKDGKIESCLIILYTNNNTDIYKSLNSLKYVQNFETQMRDYMHSKIEKKESNIEIFDSDKSGVGKSKQIELAIKNKNKKYFYFPFGGVINREDIVKRLKNLANYWTVPAEGELNNEVYEPKDCAIHLDLNDTDQTDLMTEFLFSLLITKLYGHDEEIFYFPKEIEIKIEIPNGFVNIINKFTILSLFDKTTWYLAKLPKLIVPQDITDNVQVVANFLKALKNKEIDNFDLFFEGLTPKDFVAYTKTLKHAEILSQEECQNLIFEKINVDSPNYYQIKSFIDVLAAQFKSFNRSFFINSFILDMYKSDKSIRTFIIDSYIKLTKHFTKGAFTELIRTQEDTRNLMNIDQYSQEEDVNKAIQKLSEIKPNLISFDKFNYSLIFFHEGAGEGFSIISNKPSIINRSNNEDEIYSARNEYNKLYKLLNFQQQKDKKDVPDYKNYSQFDFLYELKNILDLKNYATEEDKKKAINDIKKKLEERPQDEDLKEDIKLIEDRKSLEEIAGKYVFTADNFIKMILILLRIRANIPIIMMGETGCGKTSLIKMLSRLMNNGLEEKMKVKNIHAGTSDSDIIDFVDEITIDAQKYEEEDRKEAEERKKLNQIFIQRKLWVFLDEINTCKSMGLISELMCKHTCQGKQLPSNIVFIAACNPYRYYKGVKTSAGLDIKNAIKEKKHLNEKELERLKRNANSNLVYTVNPLPHSLLNYVFDFGNLEPADEEKYIQSIVEEPIKRINSDLENNKIKIIHYFATKLISKAQNFTRKHNEISSVSLREIRRYNIFYEFFYEYLKQKKDACNNSELNKNNAEVDMFYNNCDQITLQIYSIILGVFMCYYLRIIDNNTRKEFQDEMNQEIKNFDKSCLDKEFHEMIKKEIKNLIEPSFEENIKEMIYQKIKNLDDSLMDKKNKEIIDKKIKQMIYQEIKNIDESLLDKNIIEIIEKKIKEMIDKKINEIIEQEIKKFYPYLSDIDFLEIPIREEKYVLSNIDLEKGIAQNRALLDNIFSLFVTINNKIPIFIVGKPGCSKSLSIQLINKSMKGEDSNKSLFKTRPKLILSSYQGSMASTSQGVEKIFDRAKKQYENLSEENKKKNISMIFFDEMGLAEHSPNNPLKVIHAELDEALDEGKNKIAFVGISNWKLDASKMNRGMQLSIPEPDKEDIKTTAITIGKSYDKTLADQFKSFYEDLGYAYFKYKKYLQTKSGKEDFHGNRDFYHLIKYSAREIVKRNIKNEEDKIKIEQEISFKGLERNFGGLQFTSEINNEVNTSIKIIKGIYSKRTNDNNYEVLNRIKENIVDINSRYLLVISKSAASIFLIENILPETKKEYNLYVGSQFYKDHHSEEYSLKILNKIQLHMEEGKVLILKNLESVYPALYDLFNQNFTKLGEKNYARIAVGTSINNFSLVHDEFRCIVSVNYEQIEEEEAPFLNRFEKHIVSLKFLLTQDLIDESNNIYNKLKEMIVLDKEKFKGINYDLQKLFINFDLEEIQGIMYQALQRKVDKEHMIDEVLKKISLTLPQDIILCLKLNGFSKKYPDLLEKILEAYNKGEHHNLRRFLESMTTTKNIIYTYTNNLEEIKITKEIDTKIVGKISKDNIREIRISKYKSENDFEKEIDKFYETEKEKICFIKFNSNEGRFINYVQFFIENKQKELLADKKEENKNEQNNEKDENNGKVFIFIINLVRIYDHELKDFKLKTKKEKKLITRKILKETISNLSPYYQIFIDNLYGPDVIKLDPIFKSEGIDIYENFLDFNAELSKYIYMTLSFMKLNIPFSYGELSAETYINRLIDYIGNNEDVKKEFNECVKKQIRKKGKSDKKDLIKEMFTKKDSIKLNDKDIIAIINENLSSEYTNYLAKFYFKAEQDNFFATLLSMEEDKKFDESKKEEISKIQKDISKRYFEQFKIDSNNKVLKNQGQNLINIFLGMKIPKITPTIKTIANYIKEEIEKNYLKNEHDYRKENGIEKNHYNKNLNLYNESLLNKISKLPLLEQMNKENTEEKKIELFNIILEDFYTFFIFENVKNLKEKKEEKNKEKQDENKNVNKNISLNDIKNFLKFLVLLKEQENKEEIEENPMKKIAKIINWIQCYKDEITTILQMFSILSLIVDNLLDKIKKAEGEFQSKFGTSANDTSYSNDALFLGMESLLRVLTSNSEIYISAKKDSQQFYELINNNKEILQNAFKLKANLHLKTKEAFSLQEIIEINEALINNKIDTIDHIKEIFTFFSDETPLIFDVEIHKIKKSELFEKFKKFYEFLDSLMGKSDKFPKLISTIFYDEYTKISDDYFREKLLNIIISKNDFVYNCFPLLKKLLKKIGITVNPKNMEDNFEYIKNSNDRLIKILNENNSEFLDQVVLQILEHMLPEYFENIDKITDKKDKKLFEDYFKQKDKKEKNYQKNIIFELSLEIFEKCIIILNDYIKAQNSKEKEKEKENKNVSNLNKLYSIAFIKIYLKKFVDSIDKYDDEEINIVLSRISDESNNLMKVLKIYILKLFYNSKYRNWENLYNYDFMNNNAFNSILKGSENNSFSFLIIYFMPSNEGDEKPFKEELNKFSKIMNKDSESSETSDNSNYEGIQNLDIFLSIAINKIISNLLLKDYFVIEGSQKDYLNLCNYCEKNFQNYNKDLLNVLNLFFDKQKFFQGFKPKFEAQKKDITIRGEPYESLLYGFRFCVQSLLQLNNNKNNQKYTFASIISTESFYNISQSFIPGNNVEKNRKLEMFKLFEGIVMDSQADVGNYVCDCGYFYSIGPCGFPTERYTGKCPFCNYPIGYGQKVIKDRGAPNHGMIIRKGHYRIFKNEQQKKEQMSRWDDPDENIPNMILDQYKKEVIEPLLYSCNKGFSFNSKEDFLDKNKTVRNLSKISYRLLNFILFNHLFYANCVGYLSDENLKVLTKEMNCLEIIQSNWNLLEEFLKEKNILSIQAFMNLIFKDLSKLISECKIIEDEHELIQFEESVEKIVQSNIEKYPQYYEKYLQMNKDYAALNEKDIKVILNEILSPTELIYPEKDFPFFKYFLYTKYNPNFEEALKHEENYRLKYPLLYKYINLTDEQRKIKFLSPFNEFTNFMAETYSYRISRADAKEKILSQTDGFNEDKFKSFKKAWDNIYKYAIKYKCRDNMEPKKLESNDKLIYFLNDCNELGNGMYLAAACQNFITWQNDFLQSILDSARFYGNLHYYIENMKKKIPVQEANPNQILSFDDCFKNSDYENFNDLVYTFTQRDIYSKDEINYQQYNKFKYDFSMIEEELGKLILPEKCLFESEDKLNFVIFFGEGFRGGQSEIIQKFYEKYPQVDLNNEEKEKITSYFQKLKNDEKYDFKMFFGSVQLLIFFLSNNNLSPDKDLKAVINEKPDYLKLDEKCVNFFLENEFKINKFMGIFFYAEHLSFKELSKTLQPEYKKVIDPEIIEIIKKKLEDKKEDEGITWKELSAAVRRLISRYLAGERQTTDINENLELVSQLYRTDLWEFWGKKNLEKLDNLEKLITEKIKQFQLTVGQAFNFYKIIGEEDRKSINIIENTPEISDNHPEVKENVTQQVGVDEEESESDEDDEV